MTRTTDAVLFGPPRRRFTVLIVRTTFVFASAGPIGGAGCPGSGRLGPTVGVSGFSVPVVFCPFCGLVAVGASDAIVGTRANRSLSCIQLPGQVFEALIWWCRITCDSSSGI